MAEYLFWVIIAIFGLSFVAGSIWAGIDNAKYVTICKVHGGEFTTYARDDRACWRTDGTRVFWHD